MNTAGIPDGKDRLITGDDASWKFSAKLVGHGKQPEMHFSDPVSGRFP